MGSPGTPIPADTVARLPLSPLSPLANLTGLLAASLPAGLNDEGFPVGANGSEAAG